MERVDDGDDAAAVVVMEYLWFWRWRRRRRTHVFDGHALPPWLNDSCVCVCENCCYFPAFLASIRDVLWTRSGKSNKLAILYIVVQLILAYVRLLISCTATRKLPDLFFFTTPVNKTSLPNRDHSLEREKKEFNVDGEPFVHSSVDHWPAEIKTASGDHYWGRSVVRSWDHFDFELLFGRVSFWIWTQSVWATQIVATFCQKLRESCLPVRVKYYACT